MHVSPDRFDLTTSDQRGLSDFRDYFWYNSEICNRCFAQVRDIGDEITVHTDLHRHNINAFYERTDAGTREYHPDLGPTKRYGQTFCEECGSDCKALRDDLSFETLKPLAVNIHRYTKDETPLDLDHKRFGRLVGELKRRPELQNCDWQILAVAWARSITDRPATADDGDATALSAD